MQTTRHIINAMHHQDLKRVHNVETRFHFGVKISRECMMFLRGKKGAFWD